MDFDFDKLIGSVCVEASVNPNDDIFTGTEYERTNLSLTYENLLILVIYQNWDPGFEFKPGDLINKHNIFKVKNMRWLKNSFIRFDLAEGLVPHDYLVTYLKFAKKYFKNGLFITDIFESMDMFVNLEQIINTRMPVLIFGETGTEKKLIAEVIHKITYRSNSSFKVINCVGLSDDAIYSQIFGHLKGSWSEAVKDFEGALGSLQNGALFIEEIRNLGPKCQNGLIRYLKEGKFRKLGDEKSHNSNCRLIFATNKFVLEKTDNIKLDFYYEIAKHTLIRFPLRHFRNNIPLIIAFQALRKGIADVIFPAELLNYWLKINPWIRNYQQLYDEINRYLLAYDNFIINKSFKDNAIAFAPVNQNRKSSSVIRDGFNNDYSKDTVFLNSLLGLFNVHGFIDYINSKEYISGNVYDLTSMTSRPFLHAALYNIDENGEEYYDIERYDNFAIINCHKAYRELAETYDLSFSETKEKLSKTTKSGLEINENILHISKYNMIKAKIDKNNYAIPECDLIPKDNTLNVYKIKFKKRNDMQFSMLLFLISERVNDEADWLRMDFSQLKEFNGFKNICNWCSIHKMKLDKRGWWDDPNNDRKKGYVHEINGKFGKSEELGELVISNPNITGVYNLHPSLKASIVFDKR